MSRPKNGLKSLVFITSASFFVGCGFSFQKWQYQAAQKAVEERQFKPAAQKLLKVVKRSPAKPIALEAARIGAKVSEFELKDYAKAKEFYRHLILYAPDSSERVAAQKSLAAIYFEKLMAYDEAVIELNRLLPLVTAQERSTYQFQIARAHYNLNNLPQALIEVNDLLSKKINEDLKFDVLLFKANVLQANKQVDAAIEVFKSIIASHPKRAQEENVAMSLAFSYEERNDFKSAIAILEQLKPSHENPDFIQIRINRLKDRQMNQPGAQGFKR